MAPSWRVKLASEGQQFARDKVEGEEEAAATGAGDTSTNKDNAAHNLILPIKRNH